jgi:tetratricopeptide (TPR) repeat protein
MLMGLDLSGLRTRYRLGRARGWLRLARYWQAKGDLDEAARHAQRALGVLRGTSVELTGEATLAVAEIERDRCEYTRCHDRLAGLVAQLDSLPATSPAGRLLLARALAGLGDAYRRSGRYPHATQTLQRACQLLEAGGVAQPDLLAAALTTLAITHKELGEFERAQHLYARVERIRQEAGASDGQLADLHHNLAGLAYARQRYLQAERHARQAVSLRQVVGADAASLAADRAVLAAALAALHNFDEARLQLDQALAACEAAKPPRRYEVAVQLHNLAALDQANGLPQRSEQRYRQALAIKEDLLGPDHPEVALVANNLGTLLHQQQRAAEAAELFRRALTIAERTYRPGHPTTTGILRNLDALG